MRPLLWLVLTLTICIFVAAFWWYGAGADSPAPIKEAPPRTNRGAKVVKVPKSYSWSDVSEKELREFSSYFSDKTSPANFEVDALVESGETVVADVYEGPPGIFVISKLTPLVEKTAEGAKVVVVHVETVRANLSGDMETVISQRQQLPVNGFAYLGSQLYDSKYTVKMSASVDGKDSVKIQATGKYEKTKTSLVPREEVPRKQ